VRFGGIWLLLVAAMAMTVPSAAQDPSVPGTGHITGTVSDVNDDILSGATVILQGPGLKEPRKVLSDDNGLFEFNQLDAGTYRVTITAKEFADWTSPDLILAPGQFLIVADSKLHIAEAVTTVDVVETSEEIATEQVKIAETQRIFGIIPNFYVVYDPHPAPLTTKLKFQLAMKTSTDIVNIVGVAVLAAIDQAGDTPNYQQGWKGYAERVGSNAADGFSDIMLGGAILPSLLHQDPRYYYQGTGSTGSRARHALISPFVCKGDNGRLQPNFSSMGGDLGSSALSNLYYPKSNRGAGLVFENFALTTGERMLSGLIQEFLLQKLTPKAKAKK
jgi:Carboxypeptidase regulatory-like domain